MDQVLQVVATVRVRAEAHPRLLWGGFLVVLDELTLATI